MKRIIRWIGALVLAFPAPALAHAPKEVYFTLLWYLGCSLGLLGFLAFGPSLFRKRLGACLFSVGLATLVLAIANFVKDHFMVWVAVCAAPVLGLFWGYRVFGCGNSKQEKI